MVLVQVTCLGWWIALDDSNDVWRGNKSGFSVAVYGDYSVGEAAGVEGCDSGGRVMKKFNWR